jgi:hypothetical protein
VVEAEEAMTAGAGCGCVAAEGAIEGGGVARTAARR